MAGARVTGFEHALGSGTRAHRAGAGPLRALLPQGLIGYHHTQVGFASWLEPPRPEVTLMIDLDGAISADGEPLPSAWIGGLDERPTIVGVGTCYGAIDVKLSPAAAYAVLGMDLSQLGGGCVALDDVLGRAGAALAARVRDTEDWDTRFDLVERWLCARLADGPAPDPVVARAFELLAASDGRLRIGALADGLGVSRRHLTRRFGEQLGLSPKTVARQLRFAAVSRRVSAAPAAAVGDGSWARLAHAAGYADQSHLVRDFRELAGITPTKFLARRIPEGGLVGDAA